MLRFPAQDEVRLLRSPLTEVICQVRFPAILRIAGEQPVDFQERLRKEFPLLEIEQGLLVQMAPLAEVPPSAESQPRVFRFRSADGGTTASLAANFFALSTTSYSHWRDFVRMLDLVGTAASAVYEIPYATRVGLRYINRMTLANTGTQTLSELWGVLRSELVALLRVGCWDEPLEALSQVMLAVDGAERLTLRSGYKAGQDPALLLDYDCYTEGRIELAGLLQLCDRFHDVIYRAFRWSIPEGKLGVFLPVTP